MDSGTLTTLAPSKGCYVQALDALLYSVGIDLEHPNSARSRYIFDQIAFELHTTTDDIQVCDTPLVIVEALLHSGYALQVQAQDDGVTTTTHLRIVADNGELALLHVERSTYHALEVVTLARRFTDIYELTSTCGPDVVRCCCVLDMDLYPYKEVATC